MVTDGHLSVKVPEKMRDVVVILRATDQTCRSIKHRLQTVQQVTRKTSQGHTAKYRLTDQSTNTSESAESGKTV